jgi:myosin heavy subunit
VPDFILLDHVSEATFLENLKKRFFSGNVYTYIGEVVVAVNPFKRLDIYTDEKVKEYRGREVRLICTSIDPSTRRPSTTLPCPACPVAPGR